MVFSKKWLQNHPKFLLHFVIHIDVLMLCTDWFHNYCRHFIVEIGRECYNVIQKFLEGDSRKNENYLAHFIEFFQTQARNASAIINVIAFVL